MNVKAHDLPVQASPFLVDELSRICTDLKLDYQVMTSGAYHDEMLMVHIAPFRMIFVPSRGGISHDRKGLNQAQTIWVGIVSAILVSIFMTLNGTAGIKYGIPFVIQARSSFGYKAKLPHVLRTIPAIA